MAVVPSFPLQGEKPLKLAVLPVTLEALQGVLYLPDGYQFVSVQYDVQSRILKFLVTSDELPEVQEDCVLSNISLRFHVEYLPEDSKFRYITAEVQR